MLLIENVRTEPYFNLALEEYLFKKMKQDCFMLWQNEDAIVVGKHQNALAEINAPYAHQQGIKVVRRLSGGGTVFHDLGNVNFTFIMTRETEKVVDFKRYMQPIYEALQNMGLPINYSERNDLFLDGKKISGNAEHAVKNRVLHHGTLLFSAEIGKLSSALKVRPEAFIDKAVKSVRSPVTNIQSYLDQSMDVLEFTSKIKDFVLSTNPSIQSYQLSEQDIFEVNQLVKEKYATWAWNFGYSPKYQFCDTLELGGKPLEITISVKKGLIDAVGLKTDAMQDHEQAIIQHEMIGLQHDQSVIDKKLAWLMENKKISFTTFDALKGALS